MIYLICRRPSRALLLCLTLTFTFICYFINVLNSFKHEDSLEDLEKTLGSEYDLDDQPEDTYKITIAPGTIVVTYIVCESGPDIVRDTLNSIKSVVIFTQTPIHIILLTIENLKSVFQIVLSRWQFLTHNLFEYHIITIIIQKPYDEIWEQLNHKCASQMIFYPKLFPKIDAMIYVDTDAIFLGPVQELWSYFSLFNGSQIAGMAEEAKNRTAYYPKEKNWPYYGKFGLADSVMLMNLTRMRYFAWTDVLKQLMMTWQPYIRYDQDIINVIFHIHWRSVFIISCRYNYHKSMCEWSNLCKDGTTRGVFLLHGSRMGFDSNNRTPFMAIFRAIYEYRFRNKPLELVANMKKYLEVTESTNCGKYNEAFMKVPKLTIQDLYGY